MKTTPNPQRRRRWRTLTLVLATALIVAPAAAFATGGFSDVEESDFFSDAVAWMKDNGVTVGCNPPSNTNYCPDDFVTRGQMAVFMERLDTQDVFLRPGDVPMGSGGGDADTLDGKDSTDFLGKTEKAADADKLDGIDGADYATDAEVAALDSFVPVAVFTITNATVGTINNSSHRDPITGPPTVSGSNGAFVIDFPGWSFTGSDVAVCTPLLRDYVIAIRNNANDLLVDLYDESGVQETGSDDDFNCVVYDLP